MSDAELVSMVAVGATTSTSVRLWAKAPPGAYRLVVRPEHGAAIERDVTIDDAAADFTAAWTIDGLAPDTRYAYELCGLAGRFRTAPERGGALRFAVMSCHQPFDGDGRIKDSARAMLRATHTALVEREVAFVLAIGDQLYVDHPDAVSLLHEPGLLDRSRDELRTRYHRCYRRAWAMPELARIYADFPCWPMLDDHEVINNCGSVPEHATPPLQKLRAAALDAFHDYQGKRIFDARPSAFDAGFRWGDVAVYQLDIRSQRTVLEDRTQVVTPGQLAAFEAFLAGQRDAHVLVVTVPVPIAYVPTWFSAIAAKLTHEREGMDRWSYEGCLPDRDRVLRILLDHARAAPAQTIVLTSGDIHVGTAVELRWEHGPVFHQLTASALTNEMSPLREALYTRIARLEQAIDVGDAHATVSRIAGDPDDNPFGGLNVGIVHVDERAVRFELVTAGETGAPRTVYLSPWLGSR